VEEKNKQTVKEEETEKEQNIIVLVLLTSSIQFFLSTWDPGNKNASSQIFLMVN
jgi:hypothetical protein